eukprot:7555357-Ditylum_brightwellii.AAC.1
MPANDWMNGHANTPPLLPLDAIGYRKEAFDTLHLVTTINKLWEPSQLAFCVTVMEYMDRACRVTAILNQTCVLARDEYSDGKRFSSEAEMNTDLLLLTYPLLAAQGKMHLVTEIIKNVYKAFRRTPNQARTVEMLRKQWELRKNIRNKPEGNISFKEDE